MYFAITTLVACAAYVPTVNEKLDPLTAVTVTYTNTPIVLYHDIPSRGAFSRNLVSLGPIQVNRVGTYSYFLWIGIWATMHTTDPLEQRDAFESIVLLLDGEPLLLEIGGWTPATIGASEPVYLRPFESSIDAYYPVTLDQIRLISEAADIQLRTAGSSPERFEIWDEQVAARSDLMEFLYRASL